MKKAKDYLLFAAALIILVLMLRSCSLKEQRDFARDKSAALEYSLHDTVEYFKDKNGDLVASNIALKGDREALLEANEELKKELEAQRIKADVAIKAKVGVRIEKVPIYLTEKIPCKFEPIFFSYDTTWYAISGRVFQDHILHDSIYVPVRLTFAVGDLKQGFLKAKKYSVTAKSENPHVHIDSLQAFVFEDEKKWYERNIWKYVAGAAIGITVSKL